MALSAQIFLYRINAGVTDLIGCNRLGNGGQQVIEIGRGMSGNAAWRGFRALTRCHHAVVLHNPAKAPSALNSDQVLSILQEATAKWEGMSS